MASVRLIVFDLDGTLLGADNRLSDHTVSVLEKAKAEGLILVAASGRSRWAADLVLGRTSAIDYMICSNGAVLYDPSRKKVILRRTITPPRVAQLYARVTESFEDACWAWETESGIVPDKRFHDLNERTGARLDELVASPDLVLPGDDSQPIEERLAGFGKIVRGLLAHPKLRPEEIVLRLKGRVPARLSSSTAIFLEVTAPEVHKGAMLKTFCAREGILAEDVVAFGDHLNDLTMLRWAGRGIVMKGAYPDLLDRFTDRTTATNAEDGVALMIEDILADRFSSPVERVFAPA